MRTWGVVACLAAGLACGGSDLADRIEASCVKDGAMTAVQCACFADRAEKDLSRDAQELIVAEIEEDQVKVRELTGKMSMQDAASVGTFLMNAMAQCTAGQPGE